MDCDSNPKLETITKSEAQIADSETDEKSKYFIYVLTLLSTVGGFLFGYDTGVVSGAMLLITKEFHLSNVWHEAIVSGAIGAALLFALLGGWMTGYFGRKPTILVASALFTGGSLLMGAANTEYVLLAGRCIVGAGIGLASMSIPIYIAECAPSDKRGVLVTVFQVVITFGLLASCVVCGLLSAVTDGWRYMLGLAAVPAVIQFIGFMFMPETPRWLISQKRYKKARQSLLSVHSSSDIVEQEMASIKAACEEEERRTRERKKMGSDGPLILRILKTPAAKRPLVIGSAIMLFQQLCGINTVMYYSASIIQMSGVANDSIAIWYAAAVSAVNFLCSFIGMYLVERIGRRTLILWSLLSVAASLILLGAGFDFIKTDSPEITEVANNDRCATMKNCAACVSDESCGFCFQANHSSSAAYHTSCWKISDENLPLSGPCLNSTMDSSFTFAEGWCPSKYFWVPIVTMCLYLVSFAPGLGPMPWTINSEIHPLWARNFSTSITTCVNWAMNLIVSMTFLSLIDSIGQSGTFFLYAGIAILGFMTLWLFLPETRGLGLEEIDQLFTRSWFVFRSQRQLKKEYSYDNSTLSYEYGSYDLSIIHM